jgi:cyclopropane-fatty-acyl-phospholipid synthase
MANQQDIVDTYDYMDELFRFTIGEHGDVTCALYNGDFSKSLAQAQQEKHDYIFNAIHFKAGARVLDIGCGWGPMLKAVKERGGHAIGLTLSPKQTEACQRSGLEAYLQDWKDITAATFGTFDGIVSVGAFEHFCSKEEYLAGKQEAIYERFFHLCYELLPTGGRFYLQTMMWGKHVPECSRLSLQAQKDSNEYLLAVIEKFYPGSWLPYGEEQILRVADPYFELISDNNGRLDYIETMEQWDRIWNWQKAWRFLFSQRSLPRLFAVCKLFPRYVLDRDFRYKMEMFRGSYNKECLKREVMDHQRLVFQKR